MSRKSTGRSVALSIAVAAALPSAGIGSTYVSTYLPSGSSTWNTPANWSNVPTFSAYPNFIPASNKSFDAIIPGVGVSTTEAALSTNISIGSFSFSNAELIGTAPDGSTIQSLPAVLNVSGVFDNGTTPSNDRLSRGINLNLSGATTFNSSATRSVLIDGDTNSSINIASGGVFTHNTPGTTEFDNPSVNILGTLNVQQGNVLISRANAHSGTINVSAGASLTLAGSIMYGATVNDSGTFQFLNTGASNNVLGNINVGAGAVFGLTPGGGSGYVFNTYSHVTFGSNSTLNVGLVNSVQFGDSDNLTIPIANLAGSTTFSTPTLGIGFLNLNGPSSSVIRFETTNVSSSTLVTTLNQSGDVLYTGQDDSLPVTPVNAATFNLTGGIVAGRVVVSSAFNWTGGVIGGQYGDVVVSPGAALSITGSGGTLAQNGKLEITGGNFTSYKNVAIGNSTSGSATFQQSSGNTTVHAVLGFGNDGTINGGGPNARGVINVAGGSVFANTLIGGNTTGGIGTLNVYGSGNVTVGGGTQITQTNVSGGSLTILTTPIPPGEDPLLGQAMTVGYQQSGTLAVTGGSVLTPFLKLGITAGDTGTYTQTGGLVSVSNTLGVGNDGTTFNGSGIGVVNISGGITTTATLLGGSTAGGTGTITVGGNGFLYITSLARLMPGCPLTINSGGTVVLTPHAGNPFNASTISSLTIAPGGTLDITNNAIDLPGASLAAITSLVAQGYANGTWTGGGITSSSAAGDPTHLTGVAVIINNDGAGNPIYSPSLTTPPDPKRLGLFAGTSAGLNDVLVADTYEGDANLDGKVDGSDYSLIDAGYASHGAKTGWQHGDFNYDGVVDGSDYALMDNTFNNQGSALGPSALVATVTSQVAASGTVVPEPATIAAGLVAVITMGRRRRARG